MVSVVAWDVIIDLDHHRVSTTGIIDPAKVSRSALQNAASIAGLMLTTEAVIAEKPKKESPAPAMHGGMDEMM